MRPLFKRRGLISLAVVVPLALLGVAREMASWRPRQIPVTPSVGGQLVVSPDGRYLLYDRGSFHVYNLENGKDLSFEIGRDLQVCFAADSRSLAFATTEVAPGTGKEYTRVEWRSVESGKVLSQSKHNYHNTGEVPQFSAKWNAMLTATQALFVEKNSTLGDYRIGIQVLPFGNNRPQFFLLPFPLKSRLVGWSAKWWILERNEATKAYRVEFYNVETGRLARTLKSERSRGQVRLSPDSTLAVVANTEAGAFGYSILDIRTGRVVWEVSASEFLFDIHSQLLLAQSYVPGTQRYNLKLYSARTGQVLKQLSAPPLEFSLNRGAFSPDGKYLYVVDTTARMWKLRVA